MTATIHIYGGSRGNPGPAAFAYVINRPGQPVIEHGETMGTATNNVAEYTALLAALTKAAELGLRDITIHSDSELLVKQMNGEYRVKHPDLLPLYEEAVQLRRAIPTVRIQHVRREQNKRADELCNIALDGEKPKPAPSSSGSAGPKPPTAVIGDQRVRSDAILCLEAAAKSWAEKGPHHPPAAQVWEQIWSILEDGAVLKKVKRKA